MIAHSSSTGPFLGVAIYTDLFTIANSTKFHYKNHDHLTIERMTPQEPQATIWQPGTVVPI